MLILFWDMIGIITKDFLEKDATINSAPIAIRLVLNGPVYILGLSTLVSRLGETIVG